MRSYVRPPDRLVARSGRPVTDPEPLIRSCPRHGPAPHAYYGRGGHRQLRCKRCVSDAVTRRHQKVKRTLVDEHGGRCAVCGYGATPYNLHFHHVDPATKSFGVSMCRGKSLAAFRAEAAKCVLVCANCHGEIETGLIPSPPAGSRYVAHACARMMPPGESAP